jgi:hypothetical protein
MYLPHFGNQEPFDLQFCIQVKKYNEPKHSAKFSHGICEEENTLGSGTSYEILEYYWEGAIMMIWLFQSSWAGAAKIDQCPSHPSIHHHGERILGYVHLYIGDPSTMKGSKRLVGRRKLEEDHTGKFPALALRAEYDA